MKILCTGISCSEKRDFLQEFQTYCAETGRQINFFDLGTEVLEVAKQQGLTLTAEKILDVDEKVLKLLRALAVDRINHRIEKNSGASFIATHACFRWLGLLVPGFDFNNFEKLQPDIFINIVDNVQDIKQRMDDNPQWKDRLDLNEINVWIDEEEFLTQLLADLYKKPYYVVARRHPLDNFYNLIFSDKKKAYLSYPITHIERESPAKIDEIRRFGNYLRRYIILFDPLDIKDMDLLREKSDGDSQKIKQLDKVEIEKIQTRTIDRDYQFIYQSDMIIVLYPTESLSPGVLSEMNFAHRYNKDVYAVFPFSASPFFSRLCTQIFKSVEELIDYLKIMGIVPQADVGGFKLEI